MLASCGGGGGAGGPGGTVIIFGGDGPVGPGFDPGDYSPPTAGTTVGMFETIAPDDDYFLLRGTLPLPAGALTDANTTSPYAVLDSDGNVAWTQLEKVTRYPSTAQGFAVVELLAKVQRPAGAVAGDRIQYEVVQVGSGTSLARPSNTDNSVLLAATTGLPTVVEDLINDPDSIMITARDVFGHTYAEFPLRSGTTRVLEKYGPMQTELRTFGVMAPIAPVTGASGTLPHMFGVHSYVSTLQGEPVVLMDVRFTNGMIDHDGTSPLDDPIGKFYFDELSINVPPGWSVVQEFEDPGMGSWSNSGGYVKHPIVGALPGNKLHVLPSQGHMIRRLAICPNTVTAHARELLDQEGRAFCKRGTDSGSGDEYYSWWNEQTSRYFPQSFPLPSLAHNGYTTIRQKLVDDFNETLGYFMAGTGKGDYPIKDGRMGWAHPWGVPYGGMTGGNEIFLFDGIRTADSACVEGYRHFQLHHRMVLDRHPTALYHLDGTPGVVEDVVVSGSPMDYMPYNFFIGLNSGNPFGFNSASTFQTDAVVAQGRQPDYEAKLMGWGFILGTHLIRATRSMKVLTWLGNDSMAKDDLRMQGELTRITHNLYPTNSAGVGGSSSLYGDMNYVATHPHNGYAFQRHEGWYGDTMAATYAIQTPAWRAANKIWFEKFVETASAGQVPCTGLIYAKVNSKVLDAKYRAAQAFETSIAENALNGILETVFRGADTMHTTMTLDVLTHFYQGFVSAQAWNTSIGAPYNMYAMGPADDNAACWCNLSQIPSDGFSSDVSRWNTPSTLGYAWWHTGSDVFLDFLAEMFGGTDPLYEMEHQWLYNPENEAAALSAAQRWAGEL
ncbi:MAG: hypothetical protein R3F34_09800 [Planctomycetota bacterium]